MKKLALSLATILLFSAPVSADSPVKAHIVKTLGTRDGLSNNFIVSLDTDRYGNLWIGTEEGLNSFDGFRVKSYSRKNGDIPGNALNAVLMDRNSDTLWIATQREGLGALDTERRTSKFFFNDPADSTTVIAREITGITQDDAGNLWFSTYGRGIEKYDVGTGKFSHYNSANVAGMPDSQVICLVAGADGRIYIGHYSGGMTVLDPSARTATRYLHNPDNASSLPSNAVGTIYRDMHNNIWVGTNRGIALFQPVTRDFKVFNQELSGLPDGLVFSILITSDGKVLASPDYRGVWSATLDGIGDKGSFRPMPGTEGIGNIGVHGMAEDRLGNIWLGTYGQGLYFVSDESPMFSSLSDSNDMAAKNVSSIIFAPDGSMIVGTQGDGVHLLDRDLRSSERSGLSFTDKTIQFMTRDSRGNYWIGGVRGNNVVTDSLFRLRHTLDSFDARCFQEQGDTMWVGTGMGLYAVDMRSGKTLQRYTSRNILPENYLRSLLLDSMGRLWVGFFGAGVAIYDKEMNLIARFRTETGFPSNMVNDLLDDGKGNIYAATGNGLVRFTLTGGIPDYELIGSGDGSDVIRALTLDAAGNLWFSTNLSICRLDTGDNAITEYRGLPGVAHGTFANHAVASREDGLLCFGSSEGMTYFYPERVLSTSKEVLVKFTEIRIPDQFDPINLEGTAVSVRPGKQIVLKNRQNHFYLFFTTEDFSISDRVDYAYRINDKGWSPVQESNLVNFEALRPGRYSISVRARLRNGVWGRPQTLSIRIKPPFWLTGAAKLLYLLCALVLLYLLARRLYSNVKKRNEARLERETIARIKDINEERLRFYTNITHELKTPLTLILGPAEDLKNDPSLPASAQKKASVLIKNVERLLDLTNRLLTFRKTETNNMTLNATYGNLSDAIKEIGSVFAESNTSKDTLFNIQVEPEIMTDFDRDIVTIIVDNLLSNAMKYTPKGSVTLSLEKLAGNGREEAVITVEDTGYGIPKDQQKLIFERYYQVKDNHQARGTGIGLSLVQNLVELHHGRVELFSEVDKGSIFKVFLPIVRSASDEAAAADAGEELPVSDSPVIVLVEDDRDIRHYVREALAESYSVFTAKNGSDGYNLVTKYIPDLVISDIMMPVMDGLTLCTMIKNDVRTSHIPVVLLTAKDSMDDRSKGYQAGADSYLTKPFTSGMLTSRVKNLIDARRSMMQQFSSAINQKRDQDVARSQFSKLDNEYISRITAIIEENLSSENLDVSFLAEKMNMSTSTLYRKLKGLIGISANEFIRKIRMRNAAEMLASGNFNVSEAAWNTGFNSVIYFRQCFKDEFGVSPSEYKKKQ